MDKNSLDNIMVFILFNLFYVFLKNFHNLIFLSSYINQPAPESRGIDHFVVSRDSLHRVEVRQIAIYRHSVAVRVGFVQKLF